MCILSFALAQQMILNLLAGKNKKEIALLRGRFVFIKALENVN
jgi:hypothetical protein